MVSSETFSKDNLKNIDLDLFVFFFKQPQKVLQDGERGALKKKGGKEGEKEIEDEEDEK